MNIYHLIFLVQKKNDLNRKRCRFYYYMHFNHTYNIKERKEKHISETAAKKGYEKAKQDMKKMTKTMRQARLELNVEFVWNEGGMITNVKHEGVYISYSQYKRYIDAHHIENILLGRK